MTDAAIQSSGSTNTVTERTTAILNLMEAMESGSSVTPIVQLLNLLTGDTGNGDNERIGNGNQPNPDSGETSSVYITYQPQYHFHGDAPSKEDMTEAARLSQKEFERMLERWTRDRARKHF